MAPKFQRIVVLTGAGVSAESGVATFRDPGGVWAKYDIEDVATPEAFARNPKLVQSFYNERRAMLVTALANAAHHALARLQRDHPGQVTIVTQNVDHLHEDAGTSDVIHMHGQLRQSLCTRCGVRASCTDDLGPQAVCGSCDGFGTLRPDVVWFGEMPYQLDTIYERMSEADLFVSIGTSGNVYPAAGFVAGAREVGAWTVELNLEPSEGARLFDEVRHGPATVVVPAFVDELLNAKGLTRQA